MYVFYTQLFDTLLSFCHLCDNGIHSHLTLLPPPPPPPLLLAAVTAAIKTMNKHFLWVSIFFSALPQHTCVPWRVHTIGHHSTVSRLSDLKCSRAKTAGSAKKKKIFFFSFRFWFWNWDSQWNAINLVYRSTGESPLSCNLIRSIKWRSPDVLAKAISRHFNTKRK